jgi:hypothetical protein
MNVAVRAKPLVDDFSRSQSLVKIKALNTCQRGKIQARYTANSTSNIHFPGSKCVTETPVLGRHLIYAAQEQPDYVFFN